MCERKNANIEETEDKTARKGKVKKLTAYKNVNFFFVFYTNKKIYVIFLADKTATVYK